MSLLNRILRAAHAAGTHHKLALDALPRLSGEHADGWRRALLVDGARLLEGAKAPDDVFKDFANHVLHPRDNYWGGAPEKVVEWHQALIEALQAGDRPQVAYSAGVLGHYVADPLMPLHTSQTQAENNFHRAIEWSISRSYDRLVADAEARSIGPRADVVIAPGSRGLKEYVCRAADRANVHYEALLAHYDIATGVVDPPSGLDAVGRAIVGSLLLDTRDAIAAVLSRAIAEAGVAPPEVSLVGPTLKAALAVPRRLLARRLVDAADRAVVLAQYDELRATGRVDATLDEDQRTVRDRYAAEVSDTRRATQDLARARRIDVANLAADDASEIVEPAAAPAVTPRTAESLRERLERKAGGDPLSRLTPRPAPPRPATPDEPLVPRRHLPAARSVAYEPSAPAIAAEAGALAAAIASASAAAVGKLKRDATSAAAGGQLERQENNTTPVVATLQPAKPPRLYLAATDKLEAAPSIGPKTAERLAAAGLATVADLLAADPDVVAAQAGLARVDGDTVRGWQDEARLVTTIPGLRGGGAQLLVGAGYRTLLAIGEAAPDKLCADVLAFAATPAGHRILRDGQPPDIEKVKAWADAARAVAKAA